MPLYDLKCPGCNSNVEVLLPKYSYYSVCDKCGSTGRVKVPFPNVQLDGTDPDFPSAWEAWPKKREQKMKQEAKQED